MVASDYRIRGWLILLYVALSLVASGVIVGLIWPEWSESDSTIPLPEASLGALFYIILLLFLLRPMMRAGIPLDARTSSENSALTVGWSVLTAISLVGISLGTAYLFLLPLSYFAPSLVESMINIALIYAPIQKHWHANALSVLAFVVVGPLVEEILFRGLLLSMWSSRWGRRRAALVTSLIFGILHFDPVGAFVFGYVLALVFFRTNSLFIPVLVHAANNALAVLFRKGNLSLRDV
ncbi:MAG: CPBP family intramembrane metalloprotease [Planctomycetota bacterium]|nr:MAG: CPBP family intramembrane metalloprotease [Planctomycetota bacterium]REJ95685.1 MAG: CPBP family intramembrane metalloprotease [Planctomycetota bacterium]